MTFIFKDFNREEPPDENAAHQLGIELVFYLQALQYVDQLMRYHKKRGLLTVTILNYLTRYLIGLDKLIF